MKTYYPIPLHMHSIWERHASMEGHFYNAQKLGIKHMYITDHDVRMGPRENHIDHFDFSKGTLRIEEPSQDPLRPRWHGFTTRKQDEGTSIYIKAGVLTMEAISNSTDWTTVTAEFDTTQKRHEYSLIANVILHLNMLASKQDDDTRIIIDVKLSQRPPEFLHGHILYVFGNTEGLSSPYAAVKPMDSTSDFVRYALPLLQDAEKVGGGDNILNTVSFSVSARNGKSARLLLNHLSFSWDLAFEEGRKAQQKLADELGKNYEVTPFVTSEITHAGPHKICFSTHVPVIDYAKHAYRVSDEEAMEHVRAYGGIYSRNHPFEVLKDKLRLGISPEEMEKHIQNHIQLFIDKRAWGAAMMEVGFPEGREGFPLQTHLRLWDALSENGIFIGGYGDSDNHSNNTSWFDGNNFVAYIAADTPDEENFTYSMRAGNLYTGDPVYLQKMNISFSGTNGQEMGQVSTLNSPIEAVLSLSGVPDDCHVVWTVNGKDVKTEPCTESYVGSMTVPTTNKVNFVRASLFKEDRCILLTNPLYHTTDPDVIKTIPTERKLQLQTE